MLIQVIFTTIHNRVNLFQNVERVLVERKKARIGATKNFIDGDLDFSPVPFFGADTPISKVDLTFVALHDQQKSIFYFCSSFLHQGLDKMRKKHIFALTNSSFLPFCLFLLNCVSFFIHLTT